MIHGLLITEYQESLNKLLITEKKLCFRKNIYTFFMAPTFKRRVYK